MTNPVADFRTAKGWSRQDLALAAGVGYAVVANAELFVPARLPKRLLEFFEHHEGAYLAVALDDAYLEARAERGRRIIQHEIAQ